MVDVQFGEIFVMVEKFEWIIKYGEKVFCFFCCFINFFMSYKCNMVYYEFFGVVVVLVSWNYFFYNFIGFVILVFFFGNGIVVKVFE